MVNKGDVGCEVEIELIVRVNADHYPEREPYVTEVRCERLDLSNMIGDILDEKLVEIAKDRIDAYMEREQEAWHDC